MKCSVTCLRLPYKLTLPKLGFIFHPNGSRAGTSWTKALPPTVFTLWWISLRELKTEGRAMALVDLGWELCISTCPAYVFNQPGKALWVLICGLYIHFSKQSSSQIWNPVIMRSHCICFANIFSCSFCKLPFILLTVSFKALTFSVLVAQFNFSFATWAFAAKASNVKWWL